MECKCYISYISKYNAEIIKCPLCKSAPDLYEALEAVRATVIYDGDKASYAIDGKTQAQMLKALIKVERK